MDSTLQKKKSENDIKKKVREEESLLYESVFELTYQKKIKF